MAQQPAQKSLAANGSKVRSRRCHAGAEWPGCCLRDRAIPETLVWAMDVMEARVLLANVIEMTKAEAQKVIQALPLDRSDPCFGIGVSPSEMASRPAHCGARSSRLVSAPRTIVANSYNAGSVRLYFLRMASKLHDGPSCVNSTPGAS